ncbi:MAG TPA: 50S ribosomal protein L19 [Candidatus Acidoferrales bacterium]|nr:50S ribosomal protein L19 [Candidatus Acidoferrales bacterium]
MKPIISKVQQSQLRKDHPVFRPGDTIRVNVRLKEGEEAKERIQPFEGVVMSRRGELLGESFTVRRVSFGIGVERIFPVHSPMISSIDVVRQGRVRRAKLNYLRQRKGKAARIKRVETFEKAPVPAAAEEPYYFDFARSEKSGRVFCFRLRTVATLTVCGKLRVHRVLKSVADGQTLLYAVRARRTPARMAAHCRAGRSGTRVSLWPGCGRSRHFEPPPPHCRPG